MTFPGYMRPDGSVGTRNCVVMMPTVMCVNHVASRIAQGVDADGSGARVATMPHAGGCTVGADLEQTVSVLAGLGAHPNVAAVLIVNLGCEMVEPRALTDRITQMAPWKRVESIVVQETGVVAAIDRGVEIVRDMVHESSVDRRLEVDVSNLTLATECGGSDATSGIAANPALGLALDRLIDLGGSAMFGETSEAMGTEHLLCARAADETVARKLVRKLDAARDRMAEALPDGEHFLALGNIEGGLSTLEEKSLGAISKSGSRPIVETLDYGTMPTRKGLAFVDGTAYDVVSMTGMVAGGAQVVAFTTGKGTPVGYPIVPVVKITANAATAAAMAESIDIDASPVIAGTESVEEAAERMFREVVDVAGGKRVKAEILGFDDFGISTTAGSCAGR